MVKAVGYMSSGFAEFVPIGSEKADALLECLGEEIPTPNISRQIRGDILACYLPGAGFFLTYSFTPRKVSLEEESTNGK